MTKFEIKYEDRYDSLIIYYSSKYNVDWQLLKAQIKAESNFNPTAVSGAGAKGLAQFMDPTWKDWGNGSQFNPEQSIKAQARYMSWLLKQFNNVSIIALAAYNWGIGNVKRLLNRVGRTDFTDNLPKETQNYIIRIKSFYRNYKQKENLRRIKKKEHSINKTKEIDMKYSIKSFAFGIAALLLAFMVIFIVPDFDYNATIGLIATIAGFLGVTSFRSQFDRAVSFFKTKTIWGAIITAVPMVIFALAGFFHFNLPHGLIEVLKYLVEVGGGWTLFGANHAMAKYKAI